MSKLTLETLESRAVPAVTSANLILNEGADGFLTVPVLRVNCDGAGDRLVITQLNGGLTVTSNGAKVPVSVWHLSYGTYPATKVFHFTTTDPVRPTMGLVNRWEVSVNPGAGDDIVEFRPGRREFHTPGDLALNATVYCGLGNDAVFGSSGNDRLYGEGGNDQLYGLDGNDTLDGGAGDDILEGGRDNNYLYGRTGNDRLVGGSWFSPVSGNNWLEGGDGRDHLTGGTGNDFLFGEANGNLGINVPGNDRLEGGDGNDRLYGGMGDDTLLGGAGNDFLQGEQGRDWLDGGAGADVLYYSPWLDRYWAYDRYDRYVPTAE